MLVFIAIVGLLLAYANGANDNFKGVATLLGSGTTSYRRSLAWATVTTALGSITALVLARELLEAFAGKGPGTEASCRVRYRGRVSLRHLDASFKDHYWDLGIEWGVRMPLWGRNWPADPIWFVGISNAFRVFEPYSGGST